MVEPLIILTQPEIENWLNAVLWPFVRVLAFLSTAPPFSTPLLPRIGRIGMALAVTGAMLPTLPPAAPWPGICGGAALIGGQLLVGATLGLVMQMVVAAAQTAGEWISLSMGLGFSVTISEQYGQSVPTVSELLGFATTLILLADGGAYGMLVLLSQSFRNIPMGFSLPSWSWVDLAHFGVVLFEGAVLIGMPTVLAVLLVMAVLGVVSRVAPQVNLFAIGFPVTILAGFAGIYFTLPLLAYEVRHLLLLAFASVSGG